MNKIELITHLYTAFSNRDLKKLDEICFKDILWEQNPGFPGGGTHRGVRNIIENVYQANSDRWKSFNFERTRVNALNDIVVVEGHYIVQGHYAKSEVKAETVHIFRIENNKVTSFKQYTDSKTLWNNFEEGK